MRSTRPALRRTPPQAAVAACALASALLVTACGGADHTYKNTARPPATIVISAAIDDQQVSVSPRRFGAGPITLVISNQSGALQQVTLETQDDPGAAGPGEKVIETGPINPRETATVKGNVKQGTYALHVGGSGVRAAKIVVGRERASAQNDLLQP
jgi:hypothetical protein